MANSRMGIRCKHCGEIFTLAKGDYGSYLCCFICKEDYDFQDGFNDFLGEHGLGICYSKWDRKEDASIHFEIVEE